MCQALCSQHANSTEARAVAVSADAVNAALQATILCALLQPDPEGALLACVQKQASTAVSHCAAAAVWGLFDDIMFMSEGIVVRPCCLLQGRAVKAVSDGVTLAGLPWRLRPRADELSRRRAPPILRAPSA